MQKNAFFSHSMVLTFSHFNRISLLIEIFYNNRLDQHSSALEMPFCSIIIAPPQNDHRFLTTKRGTLDQTANRKQHILRSVIVPICSMIKAYFIFRITTTRSESIRACLLMERVLPGGAAAYLEPHAGLVDLLRDVDSVVVEL